MIWFACKQCGKRHGRAEQLTGTLVFCECGHGNRVPWASTVAEPEPEEAQPALPPPPRPRAPRRSFEDDPPPRYPPSAREEPRSGWPRRSAEKRRPHPGYCLNHDETPKEATCAACHSSFCSACVVTLQGETLCSPCKNFRLGGMSRPARIMPLALFAFILALVSMFVTLFLSLIAVASMQTEAALAVAIPCCTVALLIAGGELILGWLALRQIDRQPTLGGRGLAMTGAMAGLTGVVWSFAIGLFIVLHHVQS